MDWSWLRRIADNVFGNLIANLIAAALIGVAAIVWATLSALPGPVAAVLALAAVAMTLIIVNQVRALLAQQFRAGEAVPSELESTRAGHAFVWALAMIPTGADEVLVSCGLVFHAATETRTSPTELRLRSGEGQIDICVLRAVTAPKRIGPGTFCLVDFKGSVRAHEGSGLLRAVRHAMEELPAEGAVFAHVEVVEPDGHALAAHEESGALLGLPAGMDNPQRLTVQIRGWKGVPEKWRAALAR